MIKMPFFAVFFACLAFWTASPAAAQGVPMLYNSGQPLNLNQILRGTDSAISSGGTSYGSSSSYAAPSSYGSDYRFSSSLSPEEAQRAQAMRNMQAAANMGSSALYSNNTGSGSFGGNGYAGGTNMYGSTAGGGTYNAGAGASRAVKPEVVYRGRSTGITKPPLVFNSVR